MSSTGRPLMPPDLLMRSMAIWVPTRAVLPPAAGNLAAVPEFLIPILRFLFVKHSVPSLDRSDRFPDHCHERDRRRPGLCVRPRLANEPHLEPTHAIATTAHGTSPISPSILRLVAPTIRLISSRII